MPSLRQIKRTKKKATKTESASYLGAQSANQMLFFSLVALTLLFWSVYRSVFAFPVWFDESIGKAIFFGFPVWMYVGVTGFREIADTLSFEKFYPGVLRGLAFGGIFGFAAALTSLVVRGAGVSPAHVFGAAEFWQEFALALLTGYWESLFFFGFIMTTLINSKPYWSQVRQVLVTAAIFLAYHTPVVIMGHVTIQSTAGYLLLLSVFALGQAFIFSQERNTYTLAVSHTIWGMTLLMHTL